MIKNPYHILQPDDACFPSRAYAPLPPPLCRITVPPRKPGRPRPEKEDKRTSSKYLSMHTPSQCQRSVGPTPQQCRYKLRFCQYIDSPTQPNPAQHLHQRLLSQTIHTKRLSTLQLAKILRHPLLPLARRAIDIKLQRRSTTLHLVQLAIFTDPLPLAHAVHKRVEPARGGGGGRRRGGLLSSGPAKDSVSRCNRRGGLLKPATAGESSSAWCEGRGRFLHNTTANDASRALLVLVPLRHEHLAQLLLFSPLARRGLQTHDETDGDGGTLKGLGRRIGLMVWRLAAVGDGEIRRADLVLETEPLGESLELQEVVLVAIATVSIKLYRVIGKNLHPVLDIHL